MNKRHSIDQFFCSIPYFFNEKIQKQKRAEKDFGRISKGTMEPIFAVYVFVVSRNTLFFTP